MKKIGTWLNEEDHKKFKKRLESRKMTEYRYLKSLVLKDLSNV